MEAGCLLKTSNIPVLFPDSPQHHSIGDFSSPMRSNPSEFLKAGREWSLQDQNPRWSNSRNSRQLQSPLHPGICATSFPGLQKAPLFWWWGMIPGACTSLSVFTVWLLPLGSSANIAVGNLWAFALVPSYFTFTVALGGKQHCQDVSARKGN